MSLALVPSTPSVPLLEELLLPDVKAFLRVDGSAEDELITTMIGAAQGYVEGRDGVLNRVLLTQTWDWSFSHWPSSGCPLELPLPPLQTVMSITTVGSDGVSIVWDPTKYRVVGAGDTLRPGRILPIGSTTWPVVDLYSLEPITVRFVAGYGTTLSAIPRQLRVALLGLAGTYYTNRDSADVPVPPWIDRLLMPFRLPAAA